MSSIVASPFLPAVNEQNIFGACLIIKSPTCKSPQHIVDAGGKNYAVVGKVLRKCSTLDLSS
jgi:hypothetical protein